MQVETIGPVAKRNRVVRIETQNVRSLVISRRTDHASRAGVSSGEILVSATDAIYLESSYQWQVGMNHRNPFGAHASQDFYGMRDVGV